MKTKGIVLLIGLLVALFIGFNIVTKKNVLDVSTMVGVAVMVIGGRIYVYGTKKQ